MRIAERSGRYLSAFSLAELRQFSSLIDEDVFAVLTLQGSVDSRNHIGGTAPAQVSAAIAKARTWLASRENVQHE